MRQFTLYIENEIRGPLSEAEVLELIKTGAVQADTQCTHEGSTQTEPLSSFFPFGSTIKLGKRIERNETEATLEANRLNPDDRRKLMLYGLADAATVDQFTQAQAIEILGQHESRLKGINTTNKIIIGVAFTLTLIGFICLGIFSDTVPSFLGKGATLLIKDDPKTPDTSRRFANESQRFQELSEEGKKVVFPKPQGGQSIEQTLNARLKVSPSSGYNVSGNVNLRPLNELLIRWNVKSDPEIKLYVLSTEIPSEIAQKVINQAATLETILAPATEGNAFEKIKSEVIASFPQVSVIKESESLLREVKNLKNNEVGSLIERINFQIRESNKFVEENEKKSGPPGEDAKIQRQWCIDLQSFAGRLRDLDNRVRINFNPNARKKIWSEFNTGPGAELAAWVIASDAKLVTLNDQGDFQIKECAKFNQKTASSYLFVTTKINGDTVYLAWGSKFIANLELQSEEIPREVFLQREKYKVVSQVVVGNRPHGIRYRVGDRELTFRRNSPAWNFLTVARDKDSDTLVVLANPEIIEKYPVGFVIPYKTLIELELYPRPAESPAPAPLSIIE